MYKRQGIDIEDLPHVVNYEIPNVSEDYVHRIGRTGRAGASGEAVSLVCLDEEGFMMEIERFTKQEIAVELLEGFGPEPGEKAEPIAMGRQTLWGGAGRPPSRDVMQAAAKAARGDMMQRIRESKGAQGDGGGRSAGPRPARSGPPPSRRGGPRGEGRGEFRGEGEFRGDAPRFEGGRNDGPRPEGRFDPRSDNRPPRQNAPRGDRGPRRDGDELPRHIDPLMTNQFASRRDQPRRSGGAGGQPDPTRTSIDSLAAGRGGQRRHGGGGGYGGGGGNRSGGGGRSFGR